MSLDTLVPADDDFEAWEFELDPQRQHRPTKAAQRREDDEQILRGLGFRRHRTSEREDF